MLFVFLNKYQASIFSLLLLNLYQSCLTASSSSGSNSGISSNTNFLQLSRDKLEVENPILTKPLTTSFKSLFIDTEEFIASTSRGNLPSLFSSLRRFLDQLRQTNKKISTRDTMDSNPQNSSNQVEKVCIIGSGNWGSAIATLVGENCARLPYYESNVNMWVFEETITFPDGSQELLTNIINTRHENVKYLPDIKLPTNVIAVSDLATACQDATLLIFILPHQFLPRLLPIIKQAADPSCRGVSLIKGLGTYSFYSLALSLLYAFHLMFFETLLHNDL